VLPPGKKIFSGVLCSARESWYKGTLPECHPDKSRERSGSSRKSVMNVVHKGMLAAGLTLLAAAYGAADDADTIKSVLDKGIKALGGEDKITKYPGLMLKGACKVYDNDKGIPYTGIFFTQGLDKSRTVTIEKVKDADVPTITVANGNKGWVKAGENPTRELDKDELNDEKENLYFNWIQTLVPLKGKEYKLTLLGDSKVNNKPAVGINVASKGRRDVKLYFDKDSGLLVKAERKVRDPDTKKDAAEELFLSDYKEVNGLKVAMKYLFKWDGKNRAEADMTDAKVFEKDDKQFEKP
jgi:hypothetical protein